MNKRYKLGQHLWHRNATSFVIGLHGWRFAWRHETSFRQWSVVALILTPFAFWLGQGVEIAVMLLALWLIVIVELINTAIEALADRVTLDDDEAVKNVKDVGSSAVMMTALLALLVWVICVFM